MTMSMMALKKNVTKYFKARKLLLKSMGGKAVDRSDDMFELYVLAEILSCVGPQTTANPKSLILAGKRQIYVVACAPSPSWGEASFFQIVSASGKALGIRTGLEVGLPNHTSAELDLVIVDMTSVPNGSGGVFATSVKAACECKAFAKTLQMSTIEQVLGKAGRVWGNQLATPIANGVYQFTLCSLSQTSPNPRIALTTGNVGLVDDILAVKTKLSSFASSLCAALAI